MGTNLKHTEPGAIAKRIEELERALRARQVAAGELMMEVGKLRAAVNNMSTSIDKLPGFRGRVARMRNLSSARGKDDYRALVVEIDAWCASQLAEFIAALATTKGDSK